MLEIYNIANEDSNNVFKYKDSIKSTIDIFIKIFINIYLVEFIGSLQLTSLEQVVITLLQGWWWQQACYEVFQQAYNISGCSWQVATNFSVAINLLTTHTCRRYQTCWNNLLQVCWPHQPCYKMIATCSRLVNNWEQAVRTHLCWQMRFFRHAPCRALV
jgi:hypothetical protein